MNQLSPKSMVLTRSAHKKMIEATTEVTTEEVSRTTAVETNDESGNLRTRSPGTNGHSSAHTVKSKGNKSVRSTSSSIAARRKRLQLEAAEAKARIQMELIDLRLAVNLKELDEADNCSLHSDAAIEHEPEHCIVENWLADNAQDQKMQTDLQPKGTMGPQVSAAPHVSTATQDGMDGTVHALASALKDLAAATSATSSSGVNNRMLNRLCTVKELPLFSGDPLDWLHFKKAFEESSRICNFSEDENLWRLRKSLHGAAKDAVTALLISATSVETIMSTLELQFGNPDIIINRILQDIYKLRPISQEYQKDIIPFSIKVRNYVAAVTTIGCEDYLNGMNILSLILSKLPTVLISKWTDYSYPLFNKILKPKLVILSEFLTEEAEKITKTAVNLSSLVYGENLRHRGQAVLLNSKHNHEDGGLICSYCHISKHLLTDCKKFKRSLCKDRWAYAKRHGICFKCLISKHKQSDCSEPVCEVEDCGRLHHRLLHYAENKNSLRNRVNITDVTEGETQTGIIAHVTANDNKVLLKIVSVYIHGPNGIERTRALLDDGSTVTLISDNLATKLGLRGHKHSMRVCGAWNNGEITCESESVNFSISNDEGRMFEICAYSVKDLNLPVQDYSTLKLNSCGIMKPELTNILLDGDYKPEILLGQDNYNLLMPVEIIKCKPSEPYLTRTLLGWCVHGSTRMPFKKGNSAIQSALILSEESLPSSHESDRILQEMQEKMRHSFAIDALGISSKPRQNREERQAIEQLESTAKLMDGRWLVGLPWKNTNIMMPDSYDNALIRLRGIEKKMKNNVGFATRYKERVDHLLQNDYASELECIPNPKHVWYLPHFGVDNPNKQKLRLVFDAAAKCKGMSLNDFLLQGPDLLISLYGIMLRFRERKVAVTGDIKDMFLRVKIHTEDRDAFRFLWKETADKPVKVFTMSSLIFGANCSPFIAQFVKNKNATRFASVFPGAVNAICKQHYMDDYIDSFDNEEIATSLVKDVTYVHQQGGFEIRNFTSNCKSVLCHLPDESLKPTAVTFKNGQQFCTGERTLVLIWFPSEDTLGFDVSFKKIPAPLMVGEKRPTKREMLRVIMSIFDIYGFLSPITIKGKIMLQDTWRSGITWDLEVTDDIFTRWKGWLDLLRKVSTLRVPRYYALATKDSRQTESVTKNKPVQNECLENFSYRNLQLHIFCDASTRAMCAAAYWRWYNSNNEVQVSLISSKSRVAPVKYVSVPRLELQAALLASRLANSICNEHRMIPTNTYFWCNSVTVLHWIRNDMRNYKAYVAHRLGEIDELTKIKDWRYIPTKLNVADIATRESCDMQILQNEWLYGPSFLYQEEVSWPEDCIMQKNLTSDILEYVNTCTVEPECLPAVPEPERFSSWLRLVRTTCVMITFIAKCRKIPCDLAGKMMERAEILLIKYSQMKHFPDDLSNLKQNKLLSKKSKLLTLTPILDAQGVLRVGGRINAASDVRIDVKQPMILDGHCHIAHLIVKYYHVKACHGNQELVVNNLKQRYWILRLRPTVKSISAKCLFCRIRKAQPQPPRMGDLPRARIAHHHRPFTYTGVDLFGPLDATVGRHREKRYGVIFTCLTVRAVHIEIVNKLTTDALIMAVRRMAARRGWPRYLYSDNGTNLKGADTELKRCVTELDTQKLKAGIINYSMATSWTFIPPASPHWGGAWERLIRSIKSALYVILREQAPRDETLHTLMTEVEQMVNSRPLTHVTVEPNCEETLTPNHFMLGSSSNMPTLGVFDNSDSYLRKQWRISQTLADMFWRRWLREVLPEMRPRTKWHQEQRPLQVGDLVLIVDPSTPRNVWPKGLVVTALPGKDGRTRVVDVKTQNGILRRPAARVARIDLRSECCSSTGVGSVGDGETP